MISIVEYSNIYKDAVIGLIIDIYEKELGFVGYDRPDIYRVSEAYQKQNKSNFWVLIDGEAVVGTVAVLKYTQETAFLKRMVLKKEYRNRGFGKQLLDVAIKFTRKNGYK